MFLVYIETFICYKFPFDNFIFYVNLLVIYCIIFICVVFGLPQIGHNVG
jgi:hypothetical protein